jgi:ribosomal protein L16 Arg81 hydroxylase
VKLFVGLLLAVLAIAVVTLGMTTLAYSKRAQDISAQLDRAQIELRELRGFRRRTPLTWEDGLREFIALQEVPAPRFRGGNSPRASRPRPDDAARMGGFLEQRERRQQALDSWFQENIATLRDRARTATTKESADLATQIAEELAKLNALRPKWTEIRQTPEDLRREAAQQLYAETAVVLTSLQALAARERQLELANLARSLGLTEEESIQRFVDTVAGIYNQSRYNPGQALTNFTATTPAP